MPHPTASRLLILASIGALAPNGHAAANGREVFADKCASCHGLDGRARTPAGRKLGAKDLAASKLGDVEIEKQIRNGAKDVRGTEKMPPFSDKLNAAEISALITYVKTFRPR